MTGYSVAAASQLACFANKHNHGPALVSPLKDGLQLVRQSRERVGGRDLRFGKSLYPIRSQIIAVPLPLVYKSSAMVPSNAHHHFQSQILRLPLACLAAILRTLTHSLLFSRCFP